MSKWIRDMELAQARSLMIRRVPFRPPLKKILVCMRCGMQLEITQANVAPGAFNLEQRLYREVMHWSHKSALCQTCNAIVATAEYAVFSNHAYKAFN